MKIAYQPDTNTLKCNGCGWIQELPSRVYGNPEEIMSCSERFAGIHECGSSPRPPVVRVRVLDTSSKALETARRVLGFAA
ncbi:MAG: hypothetical protein KGL39_50720 [Patescibacteria group bacterium]|nr:hypothetical protein [Patescibacteria group bacterium]